MASPEPQSVRIGEKQIGWACPTCQHIVCFSFFGYDQPGEDDEAKKLAAEHCDRKCECGAPLDKEGWTICKACRDTREEKREKRLFDEAEKLDWKEYDGPVTVNGDEDYFATIDDFFDEYQDLCPDYVWACKRNPFKIDADNVIEQALEEHHEYAYEKIGDQARIDLQIMLDNWAFPLKIESWEQDNDRVIPLKACCQKCGIRLTTREVQDEIEFCEDCEEGKDTDGT